MVLRLSCTGTARALISKNGELGVQKAENDCYVPGGSLASY
jgi:hypothetical protein